MIPAPHRISPEALEALVRCRRGAGALQDIAAARMSKTLLLIRDVVRLTSGSGHEHAELVLRSYRLLAQIQRRAPDAVQWMLRYPFVGAWALHCALLLRRGELLAAQPHLLASITAAAAFRGSVDITVDVLPSPGATIELPSLGRATLPTAATGLVSFRCYPDGAELVAGGTAVTIPSDPHRDAPGWRGIRRISAEHQGRRLEVLLDGATVRPLPRSLTPVHNLADQRVVVQWEEQVAAGWRLLVREHSEVADEVATVIRVIAPLWDTPYEPTSATLGDAFGCVVMSLPSNELFAAVTLTHETQHAKLAALMDLLPLVDLHRADRFYAPWRDDPRPGIGLLHGLYAHLGISDFWRRQRHVETRADREHHAQVEFARWRAACLQVAHTLLTSGLLTPAGRKFVVLMREVLDEWQDEPLPPTAVALARQRADEHRVRWAVDSSSPMSPA